MGLKDSERLLILGDTAGDGAGLAQEVGDLALLMQPNTGTLIFDPVGGHGQEPPRHVWETALGAETVSLLDDEGLLEPLLSKKASEEQLSKALGVMGSKALPDIDVVIALTNYSISHTSFTRLLTKGCGIRLASMPIFERGMFFGPMNVDWSFLSHFTKTLGRSLEGVDRCELRSPNGTNLVIGLTGRSVIVDDGILDTHGSFGNLPAGEVFVAPLEGTAEGTLVLEWGPQERFGSPVFVEIAGGRALTVRGDDSGAVSWFKEALAAHPNNNNVAELGIGTNPKASRPDNVLESEKILGTVHVAFGDNHTFGGTTVAPFHQDFVVFEASLVAVWERGGGRRVLLDAGQPGW
jgi:leucyl aminopeptidase (aminopeptidase T)